MYRLSRPYYNDCNWNIFINNYMLIKNQVFMYS
jgi:hypothetical protein